jgi:cyclopropane fatty-acyl-phospholipid synthase-like methyltransferase
MLSALRTRLRHFWPPPGGPDAVVVPASIAAFVAGAVVGGELPPPEPRRWTPSRIAVADQLWGDGFVFPGGEEEVLRLAVPLGISAASSVLLLGAGAGGPARALAGGLGAWVSGHEADPALAEVAAERLPRAGRMVAKRATVARWDASAPEFRRRAFHHALALEALRGGPGRTVPVADLLMALAGALRPGGHLVLVDVVAAARLDASRPEVMAWSRAEWREPNPPTAKALTAALGQLGFDIRVTEDLSARHMHMVAQSWSRVLEVLSAHRPDRLHAAALVAEAEVWMRRMRLMHAGQLRLVRWDAIGR